jgi:hypothetical protein
VRASHSILEIATEDANRELVENVSDAGESGASERECVSLGEARHSCEGA